jgi:hypothetical protein
MQNELPQIENDLEALTWAGGCLLASYVERARAMTRQGVKIGLATFLAVAVMGIASWWASRWSYHLTPGHDLVFREGSNGGATAGFLVFIAAALTGLYALMLWINDRKIHEAARAGRVCAIIIVPYLVAVVLVSLSTPGTMVNIGDSYCYDLWCLGVKQVNATPAGEDVLYKADVRVFVDSSHVHRIPAEQANNFFYVVDDQGRRYPLLPESFADAAVTVQPGESVKSSFAVRAPRNARKLYLAGEAGEVFLPWVYLCFGSDVSLFHKRALLRIL